MYLIFFSWLSHWAQQIIRLGILWINVICEISYYFSWNTWAFVRRKLRHQWHNFNLSPLPELGLQASWLSLPTLHGCRHLGNGTFQKPAPAHEADMWWRWSDFFCVSFYCGLHLWRPPETPQQGPGPPASCSCLRCICQQRKRPFLARTNTKER